MSSKLQNSQKARISKWDKENMCALSCRVRNYEALLFKEYCAANNTTPYMVLKNYVMHCIEKSKQ